VLLAIVSQEQQQLEESGEQQQQQQGTGQAQGGGGKLDRQSLLYCERFVEFLTDLLSQASSWLLIASGAAPSLLLSWPEGNQPCTEQGLWPDVGGAAPPPPPPCCIPHVASVWLGLKASCRTKDAAASPPAAEQSWVEMRGENRCCCACLPTPPLPLPTRGMQVHKLLAGLLDQFQLAGQEEALKMADQMATYLCGRWVGKLPHLQHPPASEPGGQPHPSAYPSASTALPSLRPPPSTRSLLVCLQGAPRAGGERHRPLAQGS
jgi:hypothetical protein